MTGFEPHISGVRSDRSTNWATTTARLYHFTTHLQVASTSHGLEPASDEFGGRRRDHPAQLLPGRHPGHQRRSGPRDSRYIITTFNLFPQPNQIKIIFSLIQNGNGRDVWTLLVSTMCKTWINTKHISYLNSSSLVIRSGISRLAALLQCLQTSR